MINRKLKLNTPYGHRAYTDLKIRCKTKRCLTNGHKTILNAMIKLI